MSDSSYTQEQLNDGKKINRNFFIHLIVYFAIVAIIWNIPPVAPLTHAGMQCLGIFVGMLYGLIMIKQYAIPVFGTMILMGFSQCYASMADSFAAAFGNTTFVMLFNVVMITSMISYTGVVRVIAIRMLNAKVAAGRPWVLTGLMLGVTMFLALWVDALLVVPVMMTLIIEIYRGCEVKPNRWTVAVLVAMCALATTTQNIMPFQAGPVICFGILKEYNPIFDQNSVAGQYIIGGFIVMILVAVLTFLFLYLTCRNDVEAVRSYRPTAENPKFNLDQKISLGLFIGFVFFNIFPLVLPRSSGIYAFLSHPALVGWAAITIVVASMIRHKDGKPFVPFEEISGRFNWFVLGMIAACAVVVTPMSSETTGVIAWLGGIMQPMVTSLGPYASFALIVVFCVLFTNFTDNIAVFFMAVPIIYVACQATGANVMALLWICVFAMQCGILLPASTPHIANIYGAANTGYVSSSKIMLWALPFIAINLVVWLTVGWLLQGIFPVIA